MESARNIKTRLPVSSDFEFEKVRCLAELINRVYDVAEAGMWKRSGSRTSLEEVARLLHAQALILAEIEGKLVGSVNVNCLGNGLGEFGMLAADPKYRGLGIGSLLIKEAERWAHQKSCHTMRLALLTPRNWTQPSKEFLKQWYARIGYVPQTTEPFTFWYPELLPELTTECEFTIWQKALV